MAIVGHMNTIVQCYIKYSFMWSLYWVFSAHCKFPCTAEIILYFTSFN